VTAERGGHDLGSPLGKLAPATNHDIESVGSPRAYLRFGRRARECGMKTPKTQKYNYAMYVHK